MIIVANTALKDENYQPCLVTLQLVLHFLVKMLSVDNSSSSCLNPNGVWRFDQKKAELLNSLPLQITPKTNFLFFGGGVWVQKRIPLEELLAVPNGSCRLVKIQESLPHLFRNVEMIRSNCWIIEIKYWELILLFPTWVIDITLLLYEYRVYFVVKLVILHMTQ